MAGMSANPRPTHRDLIRARETEAAENLNRVLEGLEAVGDRVAVSRETYYRDTAERDRLVTEALELGFTQELVAEVSGLGFQPAVVRARGRHEARMAKLEGMAG